MLRNKQIKYLIIISVLVAAAIAQGQDPDATVIIRKAEEHMLGETSVAELTMRIERPDWQRELSMKSWTKGNDYTMILVTAPAREEGTAYLLLGDEVWNWLPQVEKVVKIPPSMMSQSWMGSDFTNDDLVKEFSILEDYTHEVVGDTTIQGYPAWKIELVPKEDAAVVWGRVVTWVDKQHYMQLKSQYYDESGELVNILEMSEIETMDGRTIPTKMVMQPADEPDKRTILKYHSLEFNDPIEDSFFSQRMMKRLRG